MATRTSVLFIAGVEDLRISEPLQQGDKFGDVFRMTNDSGVVSGLLDQRFRSAVGGIETDSLLAIPCVVYAVEDVSLPDDAAAHQHLLLRLAQVGVFLSRLWLATDHSANLEFGYLQQDHKALWSRTHRNAFMNANSMADGSRKTTDWTREELRKARLAFTLADSVIIQPQSASRTDFGRVSRAWYFLQTARSTSDLGIKTSNYCTLFESLFSTDQTELSHRLSERISCFLEPPGEARVALYRSVKTAYVVRSKVVHGAKAAIKLPQLMETSRFCDTIARRVFTKLFTENLADKFEEATQSDHDSYLLNLVLGSCQSASNKP